MNNRHLIKKSGFTLMEIMVVVVILGILAAVVVPKLVGRPEQAKQVRAKQEIAVIENAMDLYKLDNGYYPTTEQGIAALAQQPTVDPIPSNWHPYVKSVPVDPWGEPYHYQNPGQHGEIDIFTYGQTKQPNEKDVIGNWNIK